MNKLLHGICSCCIWCSVLFAIFSHVDLYAQSQISGKVVDSSGESVIGATVAYDKGTKATATSIDGSFSIDAGVGTEIVVTYIGYQTVYAKMTPNMVIKLKEDETEIDEVVVIGYGSMKSKELTGSISVVNMDDLQDVAVTSIDQALEGRVTGIQVVSSDGQPGSEASIVIRGVGSMDDASPLFVIDGFPQEESAFAALNPDDIESMTVLKDASSTAIYGSRGANGVIIITTKRGQEGTPTITYNGNLSFIRATKKMDVMDPYTFVRLQEDLCDQINEKANMGLTTAYSCSTWLGYSYHSNGRTAEDYKSAEFVDWVDMISNENPLQQTHTLSISGRKNNSGYYVSLNYADQEGLLINSGFNRYSGRLSLDQFITDNIKFGITTNFSVTSTFGDTATGGSNAGNALMNRVYQSRPTSWDETTLNTLKNDLLDLGEYSDVYDNYLNPAPMSTSLTNDLERTNPVINSTNTDKVSDKYALSANAYVEITFLKKALTLKITGGYTNNRTDNSTFYKEYSLYGYPSITDDGANGSLSQSLSESLLNENTLTYKKVFKGSHSVNAILGFSAQENISSSYGYTAINVPDEELGVASLENGTITDSSSSAGYNSMLSAFARLNYSYKSKYILTATVRRDGSSKFAVGNKWGTFPSAALAWRITEEPFMEPVKKVLSDAKLKVSYGASGNNRVSDFQSLSLITTTTSDRYAFGNELYSYGSYPSQFVNNDLTWETAKTLNVGAELSFIKNRIRVEFDYYIKNTFDLLNSTSLPTNCGYSSVKNNAGQIRNSGYEISVNTTNINKNGFRWTSTLNVSFNKNELVALASGQEAILSGVSYLSESYIARVGEPVAQFYGYISEGHYQYEDFTVIAAKNQTYESMATGETLSVQRYLLKDNIPYITSKITTLPGYAKHKDINGDGEVDEDDRTVIGNPYPDHVGSLSNRFSYKNFDLNVYFTYSYGAEILNGTIMQMLDVGDIRAFGLNRYAFMADYWSASNTDARYPSLVANGVRNMGTNYLEDGSYLRLKTVSLSYTVPKKIVAKLGLKNIRITYTAQNLWTLTNYQGQDPEVNVSYSALTPSYDSAAYPRTSTNSFGLTITL
ncbi:MAG: TonB-dependent receptor [Rikenellaceae bacterium]